MPLAAVVLPRCDRCLGGRSICGGCIRGTSRRRYAIGFGSQVHQPPDTIEGSQRRAPIRRGDLNTKPRRTAAPTARLPAAKANRANPIGRVFRNHAPTLNPTRAPPVRTRSCTVRSTPPTPTETPSPTRWSALPNTARVVVEGDAPSPTPGHPGTADRHLHRHRQRCRQRIPPARPAGSGQPADLRPDRHGGAQHHPHDHRQHQPNNRPDRLHPAAGTRGRGENRSYGG